MTVNTFLKFNLLLSVIALASCSGRADNQVSSATQSHIVTVSEPSRYGDAGMTLSPDVIDDSVWAERMKKWATAGVRGGIPNLHKIEAENIHISLSAGSTSDEINRAIEDAAKIVATQTIDEHGFQPDGKYGGVGILLRNGEYTIDKPVKMQSRVYLLGESRDGVVANIVMQQSEKGSQPKAGVGAFWFGPGTQYSGIYRLTILGGWGEPKKKWNQGADVSEDNYVASVYFFGWQKTRTTTAGYDAFIEGQASSDHFLDQVNIYNSAWHPVRNDGEHITFRDLDVDGVHMKGGGAEGYFFILNGYNLITGSRFKHLRHFSIQGGSAAHNVVIDNYFEQEISFHTDDDGQNLIERNKIHLPADMPVKYRCVMGIWSDQHLYSKTDNYLWNNECISFNRNAETVFTDNVVYEGPLPTQEDIPSANRRNPKKQPRLVGVAHDTQWTKNKDIPKLGTLYPTIKRAVHLTDDVTQFHTKADFLNASKQ